MRPSVNPTCGHAGIGFKIAIRATVANLVIGNVVLCVETWREEIQKSTLLGGSVKLVSIESEAKASARAERAAR